MAPPFTIKRTETEDPHFQELIRLLDHELWQELNEDQATYDQYNKVPNITTAVLVYEGSQPIASGCFKASDPAAVEIKRMFVKKEFRGKGVSRMVLSELEHWARTLGYKKAILETSIHFNTAISLYQTSGYQKIPNYGPYAALEESVCMEKAL